jgi:hypothetical protein
MRTQRMVSLAEVSAKDRNSKLFCAVRRGSRKVDSHYLPSMAAEKRGRLNSVNDAPGASPSMHPKARFAPNRGFTLPTETTSPSGDLSLWTRLAT